MKKTGKVPPLDIEFRKGCMFWIAFFMVKEENNRILIIHSLILGFSCVS